jgi:O-antigen/teichoic acid export membrane protein
MLLSEGLAVSLLNSPEISFYLKIAAFLIPIENLLQIFQSIYLGLNKMNLASLMMISTSSIRIALVLLFLNLGFGIVGALLGYTISHLLVVGFGFIHLKKSGYTALSSFHSSSLKQLFRFSSPLYIANLLIIFQQQYSPILMSLFASNTELANFQLTIYFTTLTSTFIFPFRSLFPSFAQLSSDHSKLKQFFQNSVKYTSIIMVPVTIAISIMSKELVLTFFGSEYQMASEFLSIYILTELYSGIGLMVFPHLLRGVGKTRIILISNVIDAIIFFPLALVLLSFLGIYGLIIARIISKSITHFYKLIVIAKEIKVTPNFRDAIRIYTAAFLAVILPRIFLNLSNFHSILTLIAAGITFILSYLVFLPVMRGINLQDVDVFDALVSRNKMLNRLIKPVLYFETLIIKKVVR